MRALRTLMALAFFTMTSVPAAFAQSGSADSPSRLPTTGRWSGVFSSPEGVSREVVAIVEVLGNAPTMSLEFTPAPGKPVPLPVRTRNVRLESDTLRFEFSGRGAAADVIVLCRLGLTVDHAFTGVCRGSDGVEANVTLTPPSKPNE